MYKIFIDGSAGTTGLKIFDRLNQRKDISLITTRKYTELKALFLTYVMSFQNFNFFDRTPINFKFRCSIWTAESSD